MKKIIFALLLCSSLFSCEIATENSKCEQDLRYEYRSGALWAHVIMVDNHKYIVVDKWRNNSGISIIHAESCECKNINK